MVILYDSKNFDAHYNDSKYIGYDKFAITIMMSIVRWLGIIHRVGLFVMVGVVGMVIFCLLLTSVVYPFQECVIKIPG